MDQQSRYPTALAAAALPARTKSIYPEPFASRIVGREKRALGDPFGLTRFGVNLTRLAPGAASALRHAHSREDELVYILEGRPTLVTDAGETLVSGPRLLLCSRCGESWAYQRMTCAGCGEDTTSKLPIFADAERFPHLRADGCEACKRYVITIDLRKEPPAVPVVDELVALPLDLYVKERGFTKIVPNLMAIG